MSTEIYENPWTYKEQIYNGENSENYVGFIYIIRNKNDNKLYVGKKSLTQAKTKQYKGKKKKIRISSLWRSYYGSSPELLADISKLGKENFTREILHFCKSKSELAYMELKEQIERKVMETDNSYNGWIMVRVRKVNLKKSDFFLSQ